MNKDLKEIKDFLGPLQIETLQKKYYLDIVCKDSYEDGLWLYSIRVLK